MGMRRPGSVERGGNEVILAYGLNKNLKSRENRPKSAHPKKNRAAERP
jgi:hypothetical protein